jgi:hypothetical protein
MVIGYAFAQFFVGWLYGHIVEYSVHKYILHDNKRFIKAFKYHFGTHHKIARKCEMYDKNYEPFLSKNQLFEPFALSLLLLSHLPLAFVFPFFYLALLYSAFMYYTLHRKSHIDVEWGRKWLPWHYEHHMGIDQNKNWGVRLPLIDKIIKN